MQSTERRIDPAIVRYDTTHLVRDLNERWQPTEARSGEIRAVGSAERVEEETVQRPNLDGALVLQDKIVTRRSESNGEERVVIETYSQGAEGFVRLDSRLALSQRVRRTTTDTADGGRSTVEEVEVRNPYSPSDPMRVIQQTVVTERRVTSDRWVTERQVFQRNLNGRMILVINDTEEAPRGSEVGYTVASPTREIPHQF